MTSTTLKFYSDPGHGWLEVPSKLILITGYKPNQFDYYDKKRNMFYLEEDCNAPKFEKLMKEPISIEYINENQESFIRNLSRCV